MRETLMLLNRYRVLWLLVSLSGVMAAPSAAQAPEETANAPTSFIPGVEWVVEDGMTVQIEYTLTVDGEQIDSTENRGEPLLYVHGREELIPGLERRLTGLSVGDELDVIVNPEEGYGLVDPGLFVEMPRSRMPRDMAPKVGADVRGINEDGTSFRATIVSMSDETVRLNLNHPLAGKTLRFHVRVVGMTPRR